MKEFGLEGEWHWHYDDGGFPLIAEYNPNGRDARWVRDETTFKKWQSADETNFSRTTMKLPPSTRRPSLLYNHLSSGQVVFCLSVPFASCVPFEQDATLPRGWERGMGVMFLGAVQGRSICRDLNLERGNWLIQMQPAQAEPVVQMLRPVM